MEKKRDKGTEKMIVTIAAEWQMGGAIAAEWQVGGAIAAE